KTVKTDKEAAKQVLFNAIQSLRIASILLKPFIPRATETIYTSFNFPTPWADVKYADAAELKAQPDDLRGVAELVDGNPKTLIDRIRTGSQDGCATRRIDDVSVKGEGSEPGAATLPPLPGWGEGKINTTPAIKQIHDKRTTHLLRHPRIG